MTDVILDALRVALADSNFLVGIAKMWPQDPRLARRFQAAKEKLTTAIAAREAEGWQPIETAPKTSQSRLVWCPERENIYCVSWSDYDAKWEFFGGRGFLDHERPTHWRPLPPPPEAAS